MKYQTRRSFLKNSVLGGAGLIVLPTILPRSVFGAASPNKRVQVAQIGCGRMGSEDMKSVMAQSPARVVAVCDFDSKRLGAARDTVVQFYQGKGESEVNVQTYRDYHEVLARPDIDAVVVSVPDHWHGLVAMEAAIAGKHIYVQKPVTYAIAEAIALREAVEAKKVILQTGSQQRSEHPYPAFRAASAAVRNGRVGKLQTIRIGIGLDRAKGQGPAPMPVPENLDYEHWLGPAPEQPYMELHVHPQRGYGRPGWITTEAFGLGMITNWGAHHIDIAQWAMGMELSGPIHVDSHAEFMTNDVWDVHTTYHVEMRYANGVQVILDNKYENGLRFEGSEGWVFCKRGAVRMTSSDPDAKEPEDSSRGPLRASDPKILAPLTASETVRWPASPNHYQNWVEGILANREPIAPIEQSSRSLETCAVAWIGMKLKRKLTWDPAKEEFVNDAEANAMRERKPRSTEYDFHAVMKKGGLA
jgi:myo-inositol 2-dehydrogenase / D-chiro-inositol 1-dehydrogenase